MSTSVKRAECREGDQARQWPERVPLWLGRIPHGPKSVARIDHPAFAREESFASKADSDAWREIMEDLLDKPLSVQLDMHDLASGLAESVRMYGGPKTRDAVVNGEAPPALWVRGHIFGHRWMEDKIRAVLAGKLIR